MKLVYASQHTAALPLGRQGENKAVTVVFDVEQWRHLYGPGTVQLIAQRKGDAAPYPVVIETDADTVRWVVSDADTAVIGYGKCELQYYAGDTLAKSVIYLTYVAAALGEPSETPPEPWEDWVERVLQAGADVDEAINLWQNMTAVGVEADEAYADYNDGVLTIGVVRGEKGDTGYIPPIDTEPIENSTNLITSGAVFDAMQGGGGAVASVNGKTGTVVLNAEDVGALPDDTPIPSLDGYATEQWVEDKNYLTEHQDISGKANVGDSYTKQESDGKYLTEHQSLAGYATEQYVNNHHDSAKQDVISDLSTIRDGAALGATALQDYEETDPTVPAWAKNASKPTYTAEEVHALPDTTVIPSDEHINSLIDEKLRELDGNGVAY